MAVANGKWYWEARALDNAEIDQAGVSLAELSNFSQLGSSGGLQATTHGGKSVQFSNGVKAGDGSQSTYMGGFSADDILMVALDMDNGHIFFGRNGNWADGSGNADQTFGNATAAFTNLETGQFYHPSHTMRDSAGNNSGTVAYNFGGAYNEQFADSVETDANGYGHFEYEPPSGYFSINTKTLSLIISLFLLNLFNQLIISLRNIFLPIETLNMPINFLFIMFFIISQNFSMLIKFLS